MLFTTSCSTTAVVVSDYVPDSQVCNLVYQGTINTYSDGGHFWDYFYAPFLDTVILVYTIPKTLLNLFFKSSCKNEPPPAKGVFAQ